jgi:hypothetical protein
MDKDQCRRLSCLEPTNQRKKQTHLRVYNDLNDSKYGWSSRGVAESAVAIKSSRTSFGGVGSAILLAPSIMCG